MAFPSLLFAVAALCGAFAAAAGAAFLWALRATFQYGRPVCSWMASDGGRYAAVPLAMAVGLALLLQGAAPAAQDDLYGVSTLLLSLGTAFGTAAAVLFSTRLVFEDGVRTGGGRVVVAWNDVSDYADKGRGHYVFFSYPKGDDRHRIDVHVPLRHVRRFDAVVSACVEARLAYGARRGTARRATPL